MRRALVCAPELSLVGMMLTLLEMRTDGWKPRMDSMCPVYVPAPQVHELICDVAVVKYDHSTTKPQGFSLVVDTLWPLF